MSKKNRSKSDGEDVNKAVNEVVNHSVDDNNDRSGEEVEVLEEDVLHQWLINLLDLEKREEALNYLRLNRDKFPKLAPVLWHTAGSMAALLQEVIMVYHTLSPPTLTQEQSARVCNALALLQFVASHKHTRTLFINSHIPLFLYPFLNTTTKSKEFEYLRITSLGVIGALVKSDELEVIRFLLSTEIIPLCLRIMETGTVLSKTVACFILMKILYFDVGLGYICATPDRFFAVSQVLTRMTSEVSTKRLMKSIVRCYLRLSDHPRARDALRQCLPLEIKNNAVADLCDITVKRQRTQLMMNLGIYGNYGNGEPEVTNLKQMEESEES